MNPSTTLIPSISCCMHSSTFCTALVGLSYRANKTIRNSRLNNSRDRKRLKSWTLERQLPKSWQLSSRFRLRKETLVMALYQIIHHKKVELLPCKRLQPRQSCSLRNLEAWNFLSWHSKVWAAALWSLNYFKRSLGFLSNHTVWMWWGSVWRWWLRLSAINRENFLRRILQRLCTIQQCRTAWYRR